MIAAAPPHVQGLSSHAPLGQQGFVALVAGLMALNALAVDVMLPALPQIAADLGASAANDRQAVVTTYLIGFGLGQLVIGPLSDRWGRKPVLIAGLVAYAICAGLCAMAHGFEAMLAARFAQGLGSAAPRVMVTALARDCYAGRPMARVMSLAMMTFMAVPILAPGLGQLILFAGPWRLIFGVLGVWALLLLWVVWTRLPETLPEGRRRPLTRAGLLGGLRLVLGSRQTLGYATASGVFFGALFGFIGSAQQILAELYGLGTWFPLAFAVVALSIACSAFANSRLVERLGMRALSRGAVLGFTAIATALAAAALVSQPPVWLFLGLLCAAMGLVGMVFSNFNALAMEPQAAAAGLASSFIGGFTTLLGAGLGFVIARAYDGTVLPLALGYALCGAGTLALVTLTERGRLFGRGGALGG